MTPEKVAVVGTTSWGTTLALLLRSKGLQVFLLARTATEAQDLAQRRENARLPGVPIPAELPITADGEEALRGAVLIILAVPSQTMRQNLRQIAPALEGRTAVRPNTLLLSAAKGLELGSGKRMSEVIQEEMANGDAAIPIGALSGPNFALEIAQGQPASTVVACRDPAAVRRAQSLLMTPSFRVYTSEDMVGVEMGGALKNIVAIGAGLADGLGYGANAKAAFVTRGLAEIARLGVAGGANPLTFQGLSGLGDLIATCYSPLSRNRYVGQELARGRPLAEVLAGMGHVAEGVSATEAALELARRLGVEMPIATKAREVLFEGLDPRRAAAQLLGREPKDEMADLAWAPPFP